MYTGYTIEQIEDAIISALAADSTLSSYVSTFDRFPWERNDEIEKLVLKYPALLVAYAGGSDSSDNFSVADHAGTFAVLCCAKNVRSPNAALAGQADGEKGVYDMLGDVLNCLHFSNLGLGILWCKSIRVLALAASPRVAIFSREFEVAWRLSYTES